MLSGQGEQNWSACMWAIFCCACNMTHASGGRAACGSAQHAAGRLWLACMEDWEDEEVVVAYVVQEVGNDRGSSAPSCLGQDSTRLALVVAFDQVSTLTLKLI